MSLNQIVFLNLVLIFVGMSIAAHYWERKPHLRWSPIPAALVGALVFLLFGPVPVTFAFVVKIMATFLALGFLFYFVVWVQCR